MLWSPVTWTIATMSSMASVKSTYVNLVGVKCSGMTHHQQAEVWPHSQHHARRPPLTFCATTRPVQAVYIGQQVPSLHCAVVFKHVHPGVGSIWSLVPMVVLAPRPLGSVLSTDMVWTARLFRFRIHSLELVAEVCSRPVRIIFFLSSAEDWTIR